MTMVKKSRDEPDDKALERLRQFEQSRKAVPEKQEEDEKSKKEKKKNGEKKTGDAHDSAKSN